MTKQKAKAVKTTSKKRKTNGQAQRKRLLSKRKVIIISVAGALVTAGAFFVLRGGQAAPTCSVNDKLVNSCRAWFGAHVYGYKQAGNTASQYAFGEKRLNNPNVLTNASATAEIKRRYDIVHFYHKPDQSALNADEKKFANRANTYLFVNWKPDLKWGPAAGDNATVNKRIDQMADSIKSLGNKKIFLTVYHEPENDVSKDNCKKNAAGAAAGSPTEYRKMWHNVRKRFDAKGVKNVVWAMNYMGWAGNNCLVPKLWPGNSYVDWIVYDPYAGGKSTSTLFVDSVSPLYNYMTKNSNSTNNYLSKPWGLAEHGAWNKGGSTQEMAINYWKQAADAVKKNKFPRLKMYISFDTSVDANWVGYDYQGRPNLAEQKAYNGFAQSVQTKR